MGFRGLIEAKVATRLVVDIERIFTTQLLNALTKRRLRLYYPTPPHSDNFAPLIGITSLCHTNLDNIVCIFRLLSSPVTTCDFIHQTGVDVTFGVLFHLKERVIKVQSRPVFVGQHDCMSLCQKRDRLSGFHRVFMLKALVHGVHHVDLSSCWPALLKVTCVYVIIPTGRAWPFGGAWGGLYC